METQPNRMKQEPSAAKPIRVLIADDHTIFRQGLSELIGKQPGMTVIAEAKTGHEAVELTLKTVPDIVLMDISFPDVSGILATRRIVDKCPDMRVIALSMHTGREYIQKMMKSGASGYLVKDCEFEELIQAIHAVHQGKVYLCPGVAGIIIDSYVRKNGNSRESHLTDREREVLHYIAEGVSTKKIADSLSVSSKTIEAHRRQIMRKLDIFSVAKLTKFAIREGLTSLDV